MDGRAVIFAPGWYFLYSPTETTSSRRIVSVRKWRVCENVISPQPIRKTAKKNLLIVYQTKEL
jgi:hypothetical protein